MMMIFKCDNINNISIKREKRFYSSNNIKDYDIESIILSRLFGRNKLAFIYNFSNQHFYVNLEIHDRNQIIKIREKINKNEDCKILLSIDQFDYKLNLRDDRFGKYVYYPGYFHFKSIDEFDYNIFSSLKESIENKTFKTNSIGLYIIDNKNI